MKSLVSQEYMQITVDDWVLYSLVCWTVWDISVHVCGWILRAMGRKFVLYNIVVQLLAVAWANLCCGPQLGGVAKHIVKRNLRGGRGKKIIIQGSSMKLSLSLSLSL